MSVEDLATALIELGRFSQAREAAEKALELAPGNKIAQELGQIESWSIFRSQFPNSGDFNLILVVKLAKTEDMAPNKARYDEFMAKFTKEMADKTTEYAQKNYPGMRTITGDYMMREITIK